MSKDRLKCLDIVEHEGKLWHVNTAHFIIDDEQGVNLVAYKNHSKPKHGVRASRCKIVYDHIFSTG